MKIMTGSLYFVSDDFFAKIQDPYLKVNYEDTKRPHYFAFRDSKTGLYWLVPCSSKVEKFERLIQELEKNAKKIINLLHRGVRFTPTQPDIIKIEKAMLEELPLCGNNM